MAMGMSERTNSPDKFAGFKPEIYAIKAITTR